MKTGDVDIIDESYVSFPDPQLILNAHLLSVYSELKFMHEEMRHAKVRGLIKSLLDDTAIPNELLNVQPIDIVKDLYREENR